MRKEIIPNLGAAVNGYEAMQHRIAPDFCLFLHITIRPNVRALADPGAFRDNRCWMNPRRIARRLIEKLEALPKSTYGFDERSAANAGREVSRSIVIPSSMRTAEARVVFSNGKYRRFARNVICPASARAIPATP